MIKSYAVLEVKRGEKGERVYQIHLPSDAPLGELHDVIHEMKMFTVKTMMERAQLEVTEPDEPKEESQKEEVKDGVLN